MQPVATNPTTASSPLPNYDMRDLRKIRAELASIKEEILHSDQNDPITKDIILWFNTFNEYFLKAAKEDKDLKPVIENQIRLMKKLLALLDPNLKGNRLVDYMKRWVQDKPEAEIADLSDEVLQMIHRSRRSHRRERNQDLETHLKEFENKLYEKVNAEMIKHEAAVKRVFQDQNKLLDQIETKINSTIKEQHDKELNILDLGDAVLRVIRRSRRAERRERNETRESRLKEFERMQREKVAAEIFRHEEALKTLASEQDALITEIDKKINRSIQEQFDKALEIQDAIKRGENERRRLDDGLTLLEEKIKTLNAKTDALEIAKTNLEIGITRLQAKIAEKENERNNNLFQTILMTAVCVVLNEFAPELIPLIFS